MLQKAAWLFWVVYFLGHYSALAQITSCDFTIKGRVIDASTNIALSDALVRIAGSDQKISIDAEGNFSIPQACGKLTLLCQLDGYLPKKIELRISNDTIVLIALVPLSNTTAEVEILNNNIPVHSFSSSQTISGATLEATRGQSLGDALRTIPGLSVLQTGPTISKPMIRGMTGNRIVILNNGVRQEGQQWGSEHAPEIDPLSANSLTVIKGSQALQYGSDALGGVILVEPAALPFYTKTQGFAATYGASNNRLLGAAFQVEGGMPLISGMAWRAQFSTKKAGDVQTAKYFMRNTGLQELNGNAALGYKNGAFHTDAYYSYYSTQIGIFKYSHIGSVSDLLRAINKPDTVYRDTYSNTIERPYQQITHHLVKSRTSYTHAKWGKMSATASYQLDYRDEYDTHLRLKLTNPDAPELSFKLRTYQYDVLWEPVSKSTRQSKIGLSYGTQSNISAGRQLIPNFRNYTATAYITEKWTTEKWLVEGAIRYDYRYLVAYQIIDGNYKKPSYHFSNVSTSIGASRLFANSELKASIATTWRAPQVSELFSNGIHHGTASYELGDSTLKAERCYNASLTYSFASAASKLSGEISTYMNYIQDYIYMQPLYPDSRLTISGTFPLFQYKQADVLFKGVDGFIRYQFLPQWAVNSKASVIRTWNFAINDFLIFTPADRYQIGLEYKYTTSKKWAISISPEVVKVLFQNRTPANTDFAAAPNGYIQLNTSIQLQVPFRNSAMYFTLSGYNLLNEAYREYLNRMRYYSLDMGRNVMLQVKIPF